MRAHGRPVLGGIAGFFFGLSLSLLLLVASALALNSVILVILPIVFLVLGIIWGLWSPLGRGNVPAVAPAAPGGYAPPPETPSGPPPGPPPSA